MPSPAWALLCEASLSTRRPPLQTFTNDDNDKFTMLRVELPDRPGLLTDLVQTLRCVTWLVLSLSLG